MAHEPGHSIMKRIRGTEYSDLKSFGFSYFKITPFSFFAFFWFYLLAQQNTMSRLVNGIHHVMHDGSKPILVLFPLFSINSYVIPANTSQKLWFFKFEDSLAKYIKSLLVRQIEKPPKYGSLNIYLVQTLELRKWKKAAKIRKLNYWVQIRAKKVIR